MTREVREYWADCVTDYENETDKHCQTLYYGLLLGVMSALYRTKQITWEERIQMIDEVEILHIRKQLIER